MLAFTIFLFSTFASLAFGSPLTLRDVWNPPITSPNEKTVWKVGDEVTVTWDVSGMPPVSQLTKPTGTVLLGFLDAGGENLMIDSPLATGFNLTDAQVQFIVPSVPTRNNYIVVVLGDSGNASPQFTIESVGSASTFSTLGTTAPIPITGTTITQTSMSSPSTNPSSKSTSTSLTTTSPTTTSPTTTSPTTTPSTTSGDSSAAASTSATTSTSAGSPQNSASAAWKECVNPVMAYYWGAAVLGLLASF